MRAFEKSGAKHTERIRLFQFGGQGYTYCDLNWDGVIDDADLLQLLFNFGTGC